MLTEQQKAARDHSLGSSDAAVVAGLSPYKSPTTLFYELHGELPRYSEEETFDQRMGTLLEPVIAELVAEELKVKIRRAPEKRHPRHAFMVAHPDYEILSQPHGAEVLEIKRRQGVPFDTLPDDITLQVAHQLACTNRQKAKVAVMFGYGKPKIFDVERDKELESYLIEIEQRFLLRVERGEPPDTTWDKEGLDLLRRLYPRDTGITITLDNPEIVAMAAQFLDAKAQMAAQEANKAMAEGMIKDAMKDASIALIPGYSCTWKSTKASRHFDEDAFSTEYPDLYAQFMKERPGYRRFLLKPAKEIR